MARVVRRENEDADSLIKRWKTQVKKSGILLEVRNREFFLKKSLKRKRKSEQARIKNSKR